MRTEVAESTNLNSHYDESYGTQNTHLPMISLSWSSVQKPLNPATRNPAYGTLLLTGSWAVGVEQPVTPLTTNWGSGLQPLPYGDPSCVAGTSVAAPCNWHRHYTQFIIFMNTKLLRCSQHLHLMTDFAGNADESARSGSCHVAVPDRDSLKTCSEQICWLQTARYIVTLCSV